MVQREGFKSGATLALVAAGIAGCGGSGNLELHPTHIRVDAGINQAGQAGQTIQLSGTAWNQNAVITKMHWSVVRASDPGDRSDLPVIRDAECQERVAHQSGDHRDVQQCDTLADLPPSPFAAVYSFHLVASDADSSASDDVDVAASPYGQAGDLVADAGRDFTLEHGERGELRCRSRGGYVYPGTRPQFQWTQVDGSGVQAGLSVEEGGGSSQGGMTDGLESVASFIAPDVERDTLLTFECRITDGLGAVSSDRVTVKLLSLPPLKVTAGPVQTVYPGSWVELHASATDPNDAECEICPFYFHWEQTDHLEYSIAWSNQDSESASFIAPVTDSRLQIGLRVYAGRHPIDHATADLASFPNAETFVIIDPNAALNVYAGADQVASPGAEVMLHAEVDDGGAASAHYFRWQQTTGAPVSLSGVSGESIHFQVPASATPGEAFGFRVSVSRSPITGATVFAPGEQDEVIVRVQ